MPGRGAPGVLVADGRGVAHQRGAPVRQASLRHHNLRLVLREVALARRPPSRADIATTTGLTRATVSAVVDDLVGGRLIREVEPAPRAGAGRPAVGLVLDSASGPAGLGLEVNVDYLAACVLDLGGTVRHRLMHRADQRLGGPAEVLAAIGALAGTAQREAEAQGLRIAGAALAVPGLLAPDGIVRLAPNLGWRDVDVRAGLRQAPTLADLPLLVDNEANLAALGELHSGAPDSDSFLYVSGEIGIGAGIVLNGSLLRGARGWSGELGHIAVQPDGPTCRCGAHGCLEQYAGQEAILRSLIPGPEGQASESGLGDTAIGRLVAAATAGDPVVLDRLGSAAAALGVTIAGVVNLLDVDTVVLGGIYVPLAPWLRPPIEEQLARRVLTAGWSPIRVRPSALAGDAAVVGAAGAIVRTIHDEPSRWLLTTAP